ncbi:retrovirus-related pol polyprotein from transposon TNT 1-94 [Tanacetum coccineum]
MSTSTTHQQSFADAGSETRPSMLERGSYIPWVSHFRRYLNRKRENRKWLNKEIDEGPYVFKKFTPGGSQTPTLQTEDDLTGDDLKHYEAEIKAMNLILISITNDIYTLWMLVLLHKPCGKEEALVSFYNHFAQLMNDLERNGIKFPRVTLNTKFLNCLQPEWLKYVTQVRLAKRAKKLEKSYDPLALVAHTGSSSKIPPPYYVTHPSLVADYDDDYQGDAFQKNSEDPLISAMMLLTRAITQRFSNPTNNRLRASSNTRNQAILQGDNRILRTTSLGSAANVQCYNCSKKGHYARNCPKAKVRDSKYFMEQMLLAKQEEAGVTLTDEQNDFLVVDATRMEKIEELSANICLMAIIQPANINSDEGPSYDFAFLSEYPKQPKIINNTLGDDQIDSNIIFDEPNIDVNTGNVEYDNNVQASYELEQLARNAYTEAEKQQINARNVKQQNKVLTQQLEVYKEKVRVFEMTKGDKETFLMNSLRLIEKQDE